MTKPPKTFACLVDLNVMAMLKVARWPHIPKLWRACISNAGKTPRLMNLIGGKKAKANGVACGVAIAYGLWR